MIFRTSRWVGYGRTVPWRWKLSSTPKKKWHKWHVLARTIDQAAKQRLGWRFEMFQVTFLQTEHEITGWTNILKQSKQLSKSLTVVLPSLFFSHILCFSIIFFCSAPKNHHRFFWDKSSPTCVPSMIFFQEAPSQRHRWSLALPPSHCDLGSMSWSTYPERWLVVDMVESYCWWLKSCTTGDGAETL